MGIFADRRYIISLDVSGYGTPYKLSTSNDVIVGIDKLDWKDLINSNLSEPNPYSKTGSESATMSIPSGFNDTFDFEVISGFNGFETSGYLYSGWQDLGHTQYLTHTAVWDDEDHLDALDDGNIGFVCSSLYDWTVEYPSGVWRIRYIDTTARFGG